MKITIDITPSEYEVLLTAVTDYAVKSVEFLGDCMALQEKLKEARKDKAMTRDKKNPFHVYERYIGQNLYFVACDTRLPYPKCIKAHHGSWDEANRHCVALNRAANEKK